MMVVPKSFTDEIFGERAGEIREQFSSGADIDSFQHMPFILIKRATAPAARWTSISAATSSSPS